VCVCGGRGGTVSSS